MDEKELSTDVPVEDLKKLNEALEARLAELETTNEEILERVEDLQVAASSSQTNQSKFFFEHSQIMGQMDEVLSTLNRSMDNISLQIRDITEILKKKN